MKRFSLAISIVILMTPLAAAQTQLDKGPGMVQPESMLYGLEKAWDSASVSIGLKKASDVAQERAAEARAMQEKNNTKAMQKAVDDMNKIAKKAKTDETEGLQKAAAVIQEVKSRAPSQAQSGLQNALDNINRTLGGTMKPPEAGGPDSDAGDQQVNKTKRMVEAKALREEARKAKQEGTNIMDSGNYSGAKAKFQEAERKYGKAHQKLEGFDGAEAQNLRQKLSKAKSGADNLEKSVQAYMDGNDQQAEDYAQDAQQDFEDAGSTSGGAQ